MGVAGWTVSPHAQQRRKQMKVSEDRIAAVLAAPELDLPADTVRGEERRRAHGDGIMVVYEPTRRRIVTVLWLHFDEYLTREQAQRIYMGAAT